MDCDPAFLKKKMFRFSEAVPSLKVRTCSSKSLCIKKMRLLYCLQSKNFYFLNKLILETKKYFTHLVGFFYSWKTCFDHDEDHNEKTERVQPRCHLH